MGEKKVEANTFLHVKTNEPARTVSPLLYGIFYEDINHAADGGIYAELIRNRSFDDMLPPEGCTISDGILHIPNGWEAKFDDSDPIPGWKLMVEPPVKGTADIDYKVTLNEANPCSLKVEASCKNGGSVCIVNEGY
ncbi:MAG: hypothetical protein ACYC0V_04155 [Armatimonadota bacterium]